MSAEVLQTKTKSVNELNVINLIWTTPKKFRQIKAKKSTSSLNRKM